jgi:hypothetical protein
MTIKFQKAVKSQKKLRLAFDGPSGSGKTLSALRCARGLVGPAGRIGVIDTERKSASLYAKKIEGGFDSGALEGEFRPRNYVEAIESAAEAGYDVIVIDSLSHAWNATGGALDLVDRKTAASRSKSAFSEGWREVTPEHNAMVNAMLQCKAHVIVTMRTKVEYVLEENEHGKKVPVKKGMAPVQREGLEYEFDGVLDLDQSHRAIPSKTRAEFLDGQVIPLVTEKLGEQFRAWLEDGAPEAPQPAAPAPEAVVASVAIGMAAALPAAVQPGRPAAALAKQIAEAATVTALDAVVAVVSAAIKSGSVNPEERVQLLTRYEAQQKKLNEELKAKVAALQPGAAA